MGSIRGQSLLGAMKYIQQTYGAEGLTKVLDTLELQDREVFKGKLQPLNWYPARAFMNFLNAADSIYGKGDYELCEKMGAFSAQEAFSGIYKVFIEFSNVAFILNKAPLAWRIINDSGNLEVISTTINSAKGKITGYDSPSKAFCHELKGYFAKVLELTGALNVKVVETKCRLEGYEYCEYEVRWE